MKIIQIMPEFGLAGAEIMCENLTYELKKLGNNVVVISLYDYHSAITERLENNGIEILYLNKKPGLDLSVIFKLIKIFRAEKPDVIHTHRYVMQYAIPAAIISKVKHRVHTVHNVAKKENTRVARLINKFFYKYAHVIPVALSEKIKNTIIDEYNINQEKIPVIFNGIDLSKCIEKNNYEANEKFTILHIGRFSEQKNHQGLIEAFYLFTRNHPNSILVLIGDGNKKEEIKKIVQKKGIAQKVRFMGVKSNVYSYLNEADVFVLPSIYEGVPMTLIEAMATGLPIVATTVGGVPDMLENGKEAFLVSLDINQIARAIEAFYQSCEMRKTIGKNAKKRSITFSAEHMAEQYLEVYIQQ